MADIDRSTIFSPAGDTNPLNIADSITEGANFINAIFDALEVIHMTETTVMTATVRDLAFLGEHLADQIKAKTHELVALAQRGKR